jgi:hypothetical protein
MPTAVVIAELKDTSGPPELISAEFYLTSVAIRRFFVGGIGRQEFIRDENAIISSSRVKDVWIGGYPSPVRADACNVSGLIVGDHVQANPVLLAVVDRCLPTNSDRSAVLEDECLEVICTNRWGSCKFSFSTTILLLLYRRR